MAMFFVVLAFIGVVLFAVSTSGRLPQGSEEESNALTTGKSGWSQEGEAEELSGLQPDDERPKSPPGDDR
jgi:hypothetical protein